MSSTQTLDASPYKLANELPLHKDKPVLINQKSRSVISRAELPPSPAESELNLPMFIKSPITKSGLTKEESRIVGSIDRGAPGDQAIFSDSKTEGRQELARRKSQYYRDAFAQREPITSARERVSRESFIVADVRTNVIIQDEYTFITDLSYFLSTRYQRPESSIIVTLTHSACLLFGGSFDPAYTIAISALQSHLQPVTNKRNTLLLQQHIQDTLGPGPDRGLVIFTHIAEENMGTDGKTVAGQIDDMVKETAEDTSNLRRSLSRGTKAKRRQSTKSLRKKGSSLATHTERVATPTNETDTTPLPSMPVEKSATDLRAEKAPKVSRRKSFIANMFGRGG